VFDVDKTLLYNLPYYARHGYGLESFDHREFDWWVETGEAPAFPSSLRLYREVRDLGFKTFLLTGRSEAHEGRKSCRGLAMYVRLLSKPPHCVQVQSGSVKTIQVRFQLGAVGH
uniref:Uncharacterized protein n=1 Tax=Aegilops tauschii subsp. strangulata TaxID=200361 RepID=A0A453I0C0_AEGTS